MMYCPNLIPAWSFAAKISILFRNRMRFVFPSSWFEQIDFHRSTESSSRFTVGSSASTWSKPLNGARNRIALRTRVSGQYQFANCRHSDPIAATMNMYVLHVIEERRPCR